MTDCSGNLSQITLLANGMVLGASTTSPYTYTWNNLPAGTYTVTAQATDALNAETSLSPLTLVVAAKVAQLYYLQTDALDTPRWVTDGQNQTVWRNLPTTEPFGNSPPEQDPTLHGTAGVQAIKFKAETIQPDSVDGVLEKLNRSGWRKNR